MPHGRWVAFEPSSQNVHQCRPVQNLQYTKNNQVEITPSQDIENKSPGYLGIFIVIAIVVIIIRLFT